MRTDLSEWHGGVEPVWRLLEPASVAALRAEPSAANRTLRLAGRRGALQAILFRHAFWHAELWRFIQAFPRGLPGRWPQDDMGVILWGLSRMAGERQSVRTLATLCAVRDDSVANMHWNAEGTMFAGRVLGPLRWFGLLGWRLPQEMFDAGCWRKTSLFDRFLSFDIRFAERPAEGH